MTIALIEYAIDQVDEKVHPSLDDFREFINPIAFALGFGSVDDKITNIAIYNDTLLVSMTYDVRQCVQRRSVTIPMDVIKSDDPVRAANIVRITNEINEQKNKMFSAMRDAQRHSNRLELAKKELEKYVQ